MTAWAIGPGWSSCRIQALKARNNVSATCASSFDESISRLQRFLDLTLTLTWGVAPGYYISRRWRWFADFCSKAVQSQCQRWLNRSFTKKSDVLVRDERDRLASKSGAAFHSHWASARCRAPKKKLRNRFNGFLVARVRRAPEVMGVHVGDKLKSLSDFFSN